MGVISRISTLSALVAGVLGHPAPAPVPEPMAMPNFSLRGENTSLSNFMRRASVNFNQDYVAGGANVQYSPNEGTGTFSVNYNTAADFVVGLGWQPGDTNPISFSGSFSAQGVGLLSVYGWSTNPLVEYYIMEDPIGFPTSGTLKGTVVSDGATYNVWEHTQVNQPSIQGTSTFNQYISIRQSPRTSGTVTVANHFKAWSGFGMTLGALNYQVMAVESWSGSGSGTITVSKGTSASSPPPVQTSTPPTSGTCSPMWGQCGGQDWTGPKCCSQGTCKVSNAFYSQCL